MIIEQATSKSRSGGSVTLTFMGDKASILTKWGSYLHNTFYTDLGYFDRDSSSLQPGVVYDTVNLVFKETWASSNGSRTDGDREYSMQDNAVELPIEQHPNYKYCHNHNLYKCTANSAGSAPSFFSTATDDRDAIAPPEEGVYRWGKQKPGETVPSGLAWKLVAARTKAFDMYRSNQLQVQVTTFYHSRRTAENNWTQSGGCVTPPVRPNGTSSAADHWNVSGSTIDYDGTYWRLVRTYDYAPLGFDSDYYGGN